MCVCVCIGPVISNISNVIPLEAYVVAENTTSQDENAEDTPLVEPSELGSPYRSEATKDSEHSFAREQSVTTGYTGQHTGITAYRSTALIIKITKMKLH